MRDHFDAADGLVAPTGILVGGTNRECGIDPSSDRRDLSETLFQSHNAVNAVTATYYARIYSPSSRLRIGISAGIVYREGGDIIPTAGQLIWTLRPYAWSAVNGAYMPLQTVRSANNLPDSWETDSAARLYVATITQTNVDLTGQFSGGGLDHWNLVVNASWEPNLDLDTPTLNKLLQQCNLSVDGPRVTTSSP